VTENVNPQSGEDSGQQPESSVRREPFAGTSEERNPERDATPEAPHAPGDGDQDELEAQAADDFYHDRPAATSARVFDAESNSGN
jgi:hypothetical protein